MQNRDKEAIILKAATQIFRLTADGLYAKDGLKERCDHINKQAIDNNILHLKNALKGLGVKESDLDIRVKDLIKTMKPLNKIGAADYAEDLDRLCNLLARENEVESLFSISIKKFDKSKLSEDELQHMLKILPNLESESTFWCELVPKIISGYFVSLHLNGFGFERVLKYIASNPEELPFNRYISQELTTITNHKGKTLLQAAIESGNQNSVEALLKAAAKPSTKIEVSDHCGRLEQMSL